MASMVLVTIVLAIMSCGGGSGGGGSATSGGGSPTGPVGPMTAKGKVTLPLGFKDPLSSLVLVSGADKRAPSANGTFQMQVLGPGESLVNLEDSAGHILLMGYADGASSGSPEAGGKGAINAATTAEALLFYGIGGYSLDPVDYQSLAAAILTTSQYSALVPIVASRLTANPLAITSGDPQLTAAIKSAISGITAGHIPPARVLPQPVLAQNEVIDVSVTQKSAVTRDSGTDLLVQPSGEMGGVEVLNSGGGIVFVNHYRRRVAAYIYETSITVSGETKTTSLPQLVPLGSPMIGTTTGTFAAALKLNVDSAHLIEVQPANPLHGTVGSIVDFVFGNGAFTPASTGPISLPLAPGTSRTNYAIVVLGPSWPNNDLSQFDASFDSRFTPYQAYWSASVRSLSVEEMLLDVFVPMVGSIPFPKGLKLKGIDAGAVGDVLSALASVPDLITQIEDGQYNAASNTFLQSGLDLGAAREAILKALWTSTFGAGTFNEQFELAEGELKDFFFALDVFDFILQTVDSLAVIDSSVLFPAGEFWDATVVQKNVRLTPATATVASNAQSIVLTATPGDPSNPLDPFYYHYSVDGDAITGLDDTNHNSGTNTSFDSLDNIITALPNLKAKDGSTSTVTVDVYLNIGTAKAPVKGDLVGTATSVITSAFNTACGAFPKPVTSGCASISVSPSVVHPGDTITATFTGTGSTAGPCAYTNYGIDIQNGPPLTAETVDGVAKDPNGRLGPDVSFGRTAGTHVVTFTFSKVINFDWCPGQYYGGNGPNPQFNGCWISNQIQGAGLFGTPFAVTLP